jgi:hypothetical protein
LAPFGAIKIMNLPPGLLLLFTSLLFITGCAGGPVPHEEAPANETGSFFLSGSAGNGLVFIGVAGKRSSPKETIQYALKDAAQRVAAFYGVSGEYAVQNNIGSGIFDYTLNTYTELDYDVDGSEQYVDALEFNADTDTMEMENTFIIRTTYPASLSAPLIYRPTYSGKDHKPDWVDKPPPEIPGYEMGIGYSGRYSSMSKTCTNSFHNAIFAIIRNVNTATRSSGLVYVNTGKFFGYKIVDDNITYSYGTLTGFYVLDMWINPKDKSVWTLAIANKSN